MSVFISICSAFNYEASLFLPIRSLYNRPSDCPFVDLESIRRSILVLTDHLRIFPSLKFVIRPSNDPFVRPSVSLGESFPSFASFSTAFPRLSSPPLPPPPVAKAQLPTARLRLRLRLPLFPPPSPPPSFLPPPPSSPLPPP